MTTISDLIESNIQQPRSTDDLRRTCGDLADMLNGTAKSLRAATRTLPGDAGTAPATMTAGPHRSARIAQVLEGATAEAVRLIGYAAEAVANIHHEARRAGVPANAEW